MRKIYLNNQFNTLDKNKISDKSFQNKHIDILLQLVSINHLVINFFSCFLPQIFITISFSALLHPKPTRSYLNGIILEQTFFMDFLP